MKSKTLYWKTTTPFNTNVCVSTIHYTHLEAYTTYVSTNNDSIDTNKFNTTTEIGTKGFSLD